MGDSPNEECGGSAGAGAATGAGRQRLRGGAGADTPGHPAGPGAAGERLPAERELAERLGVSRVTLREVLQVLQDEGMVESRRGRYGGHVRHDRRSRRTRARPSCGAGSRRSTSRTPCASARCWRSGPPDCARRTGWPRRGADRLRAALAATQDAPLADYRRLDTLLHLTLAELSGSPVADGAVRGGARRGERTAGLHPAAGAEPGALPARSTPRWSRRCWTGDADRRARGDARALRRDGGTAARLPA